MKGSVVDLWFWTTSGWPDSLDLRDELNADELSQSAPLGQREAEFVVNRALLRRTLSRYDAVAPGEWRFGRNTCGKPVALDATDAPSSLNFNLSHAGDLTVCAVCRSAAVGVDLEAHGNDAALLEVADQYFSERELTDLKQRDAAERGRAFFDYWTLKEAYIKARGEGLVQPLDTFSFFPHTDAEIGFECAPEFAALHHGIPVSWHFALLRPAPGYTAALAVQLANPEIQLWVAARDGSVAQASSAELPTLLRG